MMLIEIADKKKCVNEMTVDAHERLLMNSFKLLNAVTAIETLKTIDVSTCVQHTVTCIPNVWANPKIVVPKEIPRSRPCFAAPKWIGIIHVIVLVIVLVQ